MNNPIEVVAPDGRSSNYAISPRDGVMAAEDALLLLKALDWVRDAAQDHDDFEPLQTLLDNFMPVLRRQVETARDALYASRVRLEANHE